MRIAREVVVCRTCQALADACTAPAEHDHDVVQVHEHEDAVALPDGTTVVAVSHRGAYERDEPPAYGLYLDDRWRPLSPGAASPVPGGRADDDAAEVSDAD